MEEDDDDCPMPVPAIFFDVVDDRLSRYWSLFYSFTPYGPSTDILFREWGENESFYWNLVEGEDKEINDFARMGKLMDEEFA